MRSRAKLLCLGTVFPSVVLGTHGCRNPTQVTMDLQTNVACADMRGADIFVASDAHVAETRAALTPDGLRVPTATTTACTEGPAPRRIGTLVLTPSGGSGAVVVVGSFGSARPEDCTAAHFAPECIVARRQFTFIDHMAVDLPIVLDPSCAGVPCNENSTCSGKLCVDSKVDCSNGTCNDPGVASDGGLVVAVDGASPIMVDSASPVDASPDGASDGSTPPMDAASDAPSEGGDAGQGPGSCPASASCLDGMTTCASVVNQQMCCYASVPASCTSGTCPTIAGCCRGAADCPGEVCCASTATATPTTTVSCRSAVACSKFGGVPVCSAADPTCGVRSCAQGVHYGNGGVPDYFRCS